MVFDLPFQRAKTSPSLAVDCAVCKQYPATRTFPTDDDIATPFCAGCRSAFERKATYGQFTRNSPKCSLCGSHQHRNNRQAPTPHDPSNIKGWYKKSSTGQLHCVPCAVSLRRQGRNPTFPPTDSTPPQVPSTIRHFRCLINDNSCTPSYNTQGPASGGRFLHHYLCPRHGPNSGVNANTLTTARAWDYIRQHHPTNQEVPISRIVTFVTHCIDTGTPLTADTLATLAEFATDQEIELSSLTTAATPPSPSFPMWLLTQPLPHPTMVNHTSLTTQTGETSPPRVTDTIHPTMLTDLPLLRHQSDRPHLPHFRGRTKPLSKWASSPLCFETQSRLGNKADKAIFRNRRSTNLR